MHVHDAANRLLACGLVSHEPETPRQRSLHFSTGMSWHKEIQGGQEYICLDEEEEEAEADHEAGEQISRGLVAEQKIKQPDVVELDCSSDGGEKAGDDEEEMPVRSKRKVKVPDLDEEDRQKKDEIEAEPIVEAKKAVIVESEAIIKEHKDLNPNIVSRRNQVQKVRKRRLGEEDAAFLLFYGDRETPSASNLQLIIDFILGGVGASNTIFSRLVKYLLWKKLRAALKAGLVSRRSVQSEWTKIVFSCPVPDHRRRSGPMSRQTLLPRPVTITVRPLQFVQSSIQCPTPSVVHGGAEAAIRSEAASSRKITPNLVKSSRRRSRKRPLRAIRSEEMATDDQPVVLSPRKIHRKNSDTLVMPRPVVSAKNPSSPTTSSILLEPLLFNCYTLGENRSLPIGWRACSHFGEQVLMEPSIKVQPVEVNPMLQMTADEIAQHIASLRREGRFTSFEKVTDILSKLMSDPRNRQGVFNTPVDPVALKLPTYTTIVERPMDLGTIRRKLAAGEYLELQDFIADVRLVFENAMLFNHESHYIHVDAKSLLRRFNESVTAEQNRQAERQLVHHKCHVCRGNTCIVCNQQCLDVAQPNLQCSAGCSTEIRKGSSYYLSKDGTRVWCQNCRSRLARDQRKDAVLASLVKKKSEAGVEPWVKCGECSKWLHQVCGLYNPVIGAYTSHETINAVSDGIMLGANLYVCPLCRCERKRSTPTPKSSLRKIIHVDPDENTPYRSCLSIPSCELSLFIETSLRCGLREAGEHEAAETLYVRALSFPGERMTLPERVVRVFEQNAQLHAHMRPEMASRAQRLPAQLKYLSRGLYLFQKQEGMEVCLFTIYAQEFGDECELEANRRAVYIAYLDSVRYLRPASARTAAYHLILLAYFDYVRLHGFSRVHIWSCPPQKRISYVFWCRPPFQKTPSADHLRQWYNKLLVKAKERGIVKDWTTLYDRYFSDSVCDSTPNGDSKPATTCVSKKENEGVGVSTRGTTIESVHAEELVWPATQLPPIFDGDIIPSELERILGQIFSKKEKKKRSNEKKLAAHGKFSDVDGKGGQCSVGESTSSASIQSGQVDAKVSEVFSKCQFAVKRLKQDLLVVDLVVPDANGESGEVERPTVCRPEALVPSWYRQVPRFFGSRFMFHQLCSHAGYQFDSLRRAKHSTMMMLHHYFNERVVQLNVFCQECSLLITRADFWSCPSCIRYALCDTCFELRRNEHPHQLVFGSTSLKIPLKDVERVSAAANR
ncbi:hypothetical protein PsorP6_006327 [Peronosclerospora sorghi]|uniref:Uncharacterized protein n=1 Tax=Peronosclerospora sorghi TaxID=230839 RepID=A0ACC0W883_9STRA|nr:hypothetical protein PsorP6_006327 [Peronosclerospora sorghi]